MKFLILVAIAFLINGCGVKGMPLPPINPIPVGEGKIRYQKEEQLKNKKKETKTAPSEENALEQSEGGT